MNAERDALSERPWRYRLAVLVGSLLVLGALHRAYVHSPVVERIARLHEQIGSAQLEARKRKNERARVPKLEYEIARVKREVEARIADIARVRDRPVLLARLSQMARAGGPKILRFRPREEIQREGYVELPVQLELEGRYHDFVRFLGKLVKIPYLSRLGGLTIARQDTARSPSPLGISLEILTYALPETMETHRTGPASASLDPQREIPGLAQADRSLEGIDSSDRLRDPFQPAEGFPCDKPGNSLESYDLSELRLVGIVWESHEPKGLIIDGRSSGHIVSPGSRIGNRGGIVESITPTHIVVREHSAGPAPSISVALSVFTFDRTAEEQSESEPGAGANGRGGERAFPPLSACATP